MNIPRIAFYTLGTVLISIAAVNLIRATVELAKIGEWDAVLFVAATFAYIALGTYLKLSSGN